MGESVENRYTEMMCDSVWLVYTTYVGIWDKEQVSICKLPKLEHGTNSNLVLSLYFGAVDGTLPAMQT